MSVSAEEHDEAFPGGEVTVVGIKVRDVGEVKVAKSTDSSLAVGDSVLLELENDLTYGRVASPPRTQPFTPPMRMMRSILRKATAADETAIAHQKTQSDAGRAFCRERAVALGLDMKIVDVYGSLQRRILTVTYTADARVDFRQLVKDLARHFSCRIEMRQISSREEARWLSGVDTCGLVLCCAGFLTDFEPVTRAFSRRESMSSADSRRIGVCGRLKCCLLFERDDWPVTPSSPPQLIHPTRS